MLLIAQIKRPVALNAMQKIPTLYKKPLKITDKKYQKLVFLPIKITKLLSSWPDTG